MTLFKHVLFETCTINYKLSLNKAALLKCECNLQFSAAYGFPCKFSLLIIINKLVKLFRDRIVRKTTCHTFHFNEGHTKASHHCQHLSFHDISWRTSYHQR